MAKGKRGSTGIRCPLCRAMVHCTARRSTIFKGDSDRTFVRFSGLCKCDCIEVRVHRQFRLQSAQTNAKKAYRQVVESFGVKIGLPDDTARLFGVKESADNDE